MCTFVVQVVGLYQHLSRLCLYGLCSYSQRIGPNLKKEKENLKANFKLFGVWARDILGYYFENLPSKLYYMLVLIDSGQARSPHMYPYSL